MYAGDETLSADDDAFGPFAEFDPLGSGEEDGECEHWECEDADDTGRATHGWCVECGVTVAY